MYSCYSDKYVTNQGDTWDLISSAFYATPFYIDKLIKENPYYSDVLIFSGGEKINIPIIESGASDLLPPWKRG